MISHNRFIESILFEDSSMIVVNKPSGVLSVPDRYDALKESFSEMAKAYQGSNVENVHRLDRDTSGILLFAKNKNAFKCINDQFENRTVSKKYVAVISPDYPFNEFTVKTGISPSSVPGKMKIDPRGKDSLTHFKVRHHCPPDYSIVEAFPETGRTHQIRLHCASLGFPIAGDSLYGSVKSSSSKKIAPWSKKSLIKDPALSRLALHAFEVSILHPESGERMTFRAPLPKDLECFISTLQTLS